MGDSVAVAFFIIFLFAIFVTQCTDDGSKNFYQSSVRYVLEKSELCDKYGALYSDKCPEVIEQRKIILSGGIVDFNDYKPSRDAE